MTHSRTGEDLGKVLALLRRAGAPEYPASYGHTLCSDSSAIEVNLGDRAAVLHGAELAEKAGLSVPPRRMNQVLPDTGELSGVLLWAPARVTAEVAGQSWPRFSHCWSRKVACISMLTHDTLRLHSHRRVVAVLLPFFRAVPP